MKNSEQWRPTKFEPAGTGWHASRQPHQLLPASRLAADCFIGRYTDAIREFAHGRLLDHGAGKSPLYGIYRDVVTDTVTIDWDQSLHGTDYIDICADLNQTMPFDDESFDTIVSSDVVAHLYRPNHTMGDFSRILRSGGVLILGTPFNYWMNEQPHDYFRWSKHAIARMAQDCSLSVERLWQCGGTQEVLADVSLKILQGKAPRMVGIADRFLRTIRLVDPTRERPSPFTLGTVAVLRKK